MSDRDDDEPLSHPHDPRVLATIRAVLLENRWPRHELEDGTATVEARAWDTEPRPTTVGGWKALCRKIAKDMAIDRTRSEMKGGKDSARPTDRADEHEAANSGRTMDATIDRRKAIDKIAAQLAPDERPLFVKLALGSTQTEIADELKMAPRQVSRQVSQMRTRFGRVLAPAGLMAVLAVGRVLPLQGLAGPRRAGAQPAAIAVLRPEHPARPVARAARPAAAREGRRAAQGRRGGVRGREVGRVLLARR